jgi:Ca2+-transporting ATPase
MGSTEAPRRALALLRRGVDAVRRARGGDDEDALAEDDDAEPPPAWHALDAGEVLRTLDTSLARGLSAAKAARALAVAGPNVLAGIAPRSSLDIVAGQIFTVPTALLAGAAGVSVLLGDLWEAGAITLVVGSNVVVGYFTESRAEELLSAWGALRAERARVVRDGREEVVRAIDLVPGDVMVLRPGDPVAADARVVASDGLAVDESTLTGESEPAEKAADACPRDATLADRRSMVYTGTNVASGDGHAVVVATGERTELGAVQRALSRGARRAAPLERDLDVLGKRLAGIAAVSALGVTGLGLLRGLGARELAKSAIALGVAAIPEGLPAVGTTALALASKRLFGEGIVIRRLAAAETLGAVSVVCADKTGTLTENRMRVEAIELEGDGRADVAWAESGRVARLDAEGSLDRDRLRELALIAALNSDAEVDASGAVERGSGTERALVELAVALGCDVRAERRRARRVDERRRTALARVHDDDARSPDGGAPRAREGRARGGDRALRRARAGGARSRARAERRARLARPPGARVRVASRRRSAAARGPCGPARPDAPGRARGHRGAPPRRRHVVHGHGRSAAHGPRDRGGARHPGRGDVQPRDARGEGGHRRGAAPRRAPRRDDGRRRERRPRAEGRGRGHRDGPARHGRRARRGRRRARER